MFVLAEATHEHGAAAHRSFLPLNRRHGQTCTRWQLNNQLDERVDAAVLR